MTNHLYNVYPIISAPFSAAPSATATIAENLFVGGTGKFIVDPANRLEAPNVPILADTKISLCGKKGCIGCTSTHNMKTTSPDYHIFSSVVAKNPPADRGVVIVLSSTVSSAARVEDLENVLVAAENASAGNLDVFYFAKWLDRPEQFEVLSTLSTGGKVVRSWNANGFQAIAFTPAGFATLKAKYHPDTNPVVCRSFSQVLNLLIQQGTLYAATTTPSMLQYDSTLVSIRSANSASLAPFSYLRSCEVRGDTHPDRPLNRRISADLSLFWVVIVIVVATISAWILLKVGSFYKMSSIASVL